MHGIIQSWFDLITLKSSDTYDILPPHKADHLYRQVIECFLVVCICLIAPVDELVIVPENQAASF